MNYEIEQSESNKEQSGNKYHDLFNSIRDGLVLLDEDGRFKECNKAFIDIIGYTEEELKNMKSLDVISGKWRTTYKNLSKQVYEKGNSEEFERRYICKDGRSIVVLIKGWLAYKNFQNLDIWILFHDITFKKKLEGKLFDNEQKYHSIFDSINVPVFIIDGETRKILDVNRNLLETFGYMKDELLNMKFELFSMEPLTSIEMIDEIMKGKIKQIPIRWYLKKNNAPIPVAITIGTYLWDGKKIICGIIRDITDYLNENIKSTNLINKISQLDIDITDFMKILKTNYVSPPAINFISYGITEKELRTIFLITQGLSNKEISEKLFIAEITVKKHISSIFRKLNIKKRAELINFIINNKIKI